MEKLTEKQALDWYCESCVHQKNCDEFDACCSFKSFIKIGKQKGHVFKNCPWKYTSAGDSYREYAKREISDMSCIGLLDHANAAIQELQNKLDKHEKKS